MKLFANLADAYFPLKSKQTLQYLSFPANFSCQEIIFFVKPQLSYAKFPTDIFESSNITTIAMQKRNLNTISRGEILEEIQPASIMPLATGMAFIIIGSRPATCFFHLQTYLITAGSISLLIPLLAFAFRFIYQKIYHDDYVDSFEAMILEIMKYFSKAVVAFEILIILYGFFLVAANLPKWTWNDPNEETYCELGLMIFSMTFLGLCGSIIFLGAMIFLIIWGSNRPN